MENSSQFVSIDSINSLSFYGRLIGGPIKHNYKLQTVGFHKFDRISVILSRISVAFFSDATQKTRI